MPVEVTHPFVSLVPDTGDPNEVGPNEWNAAHTITGLGTAAEADSTDFATAAQGALADTAVQAAALDGLVSANTDVAANTAARHAAVTLAGEDYLSLVGQQITANAIDLDNLSATGTPSAGTFLRGDNTWASPAGSGDMTAAVYDPQNIAGDAFARANHTGTQTAATISDFDAEVSNNADVAANTSARHAAVTVTDSAEINFTLVGQDITASLVAASIDESKLDASVNASLDLADSALQASAIGVTVQAYDADLTTWASLTPSASAQSLVTAANYAAMRALLDLEAGTDFYSIAAANAAFQPIDADLTSWAGVTRASGFDTFAATPSSANLRALLSDEAGAGAAYFVGGALGTPASGTATNLTGLPLSSGVTGQLPLANGGTGSNLTDPNADRVLFWDDSAGAMTWLTMGTNLTITGTTLNAAGGSGQPIPTSSAFAVGTLLLCSNQSGGTVSDGATTAGSGLRCGTSAGGALTGTWQCVQGATVNASALGYFVRTA
jgi:hypothetical protein